MVSGSCNLTLDRIDSLYSAVITAGTYRASSIKVAEAAKVIENTQRDVNIALVNELAMLFHKLDLDTNDVLEAAGTKWNFLPFKPGLVGGHCIGVDPYYLTSKAQQVGFHPKIIVGGRAVNDGMAEYIANQVFLALAQDNVPINRTKVLILGLTFKENCPDTRNTKVVDLAAALEDRGVNITLVDPICLETSLKLKGELRPILNVVPEGEVYDAIVFAVAHDEFTYCDAEWFINHLTRKGKIFDVKGVAPRISRTWRL